MAPEGMLWASRASWSLWVSAAIGVWLMFAPGALGIGIEQAAADSDHLVGALVIVMAIVSLSEVARPKCFLNVPFGLWLMVRSQPLGKLREHYETFDKIVLGAHVRGQDSVIASASRQRSVRAALSSHQASIPDASAAASYDYQKE